jgi:hypothetical protein
VFINTVVRLPQSQLNLGRTQAEQNENDKLGIIVGWNGNGTANVEVRNGFTVRNRERWELTPLGNGQVPERNEVG